MKTKTTHRNRIAGIVICGLLSLILVSSLIQAFHLPEAERKLAAWLGLITVILVFLMDVTFVKHEQWSRRYLKHITLGVFGMGILVHFWGFIECWKMPIPTALLHSIIASLELFFSESNLGEIILENHHILDSAVYVPLYIFVYSAAISVSLFYLFLVFGQRMKSRGWLKKHKVDLSCQEQTQWHIMFGINENSIALAKDLLGSNNDTNYVIFIEEPVERGEVKLSLANIAEFFSISDTAEERLQKRLECTGHVTLLTLSKSMREAIDKRQYKSLSTANFCQLIGLDGLSAWLSYKRVSNVDAEKHDDYSSSEDHFDEPKVSLYIIGESDDGNRTACQAFMSLADINCRIYCHAQPKDDIVLYPDCAADNDMLVEYVDSAHLAVEQLKKERDPIDDNHLFHPVNYVHIDREKGCVKSTFTAMLLGFGQTGQEALDFLYSFGAFVGEDHCRSPYDFYVYDDHMPEKEGKYRAARPGLDYSKISFQNVPVGTSAFWGQFTHEQNLGPHRIALDERVNYIVVSMGNDELNFRTGIELCEWICHKKETGKTLPLVAVHVRNASEALMQKLFFYQKKFNSLVRLEIFGQHKKIWSYDIITNYSLFKHASDYYRSYLQAAGYPINESFTSRHRIIEEDVKIVNSLSGKEYYEKLNRIYKKVRQESQDIENCLHQYSKRQLCNPELYDLASLIPVNHTALHKEGEKSYADDWMEHFPVKHPEIPAETLKKAGLVFENLAIGEHIRWQASHETLGYTFGPSTDEILKRHCCITPYSDLSSEVKHFDWIVIKTSLPKQNLSNSEVGSQE